MNSGVKANRLQIRRVAAVFFACVATITWSPEGRSASAPFPYLAPVAHHGKERGRQHSEGTARQWCEGSKTLLSHWRQVQVAIRTLLSSPIFPSRPKLPCTHASSGETASILWVQLLVGFESPEPACSFLLRAMGRACRGDGHVGQEKRTLSSLESLEAGIIHLTKTDAFKRSSSYVSSFLTGRLKSSACGPGGASKCLRTIGVSVSVVINEGMSPGPCFVFLLLGLQKERGPIQISRFGGWIGKSTFYG